MHADDFETVLARPEPVRRSPRELRRAAHRLWQARDRASRADRPVSSDVIRVPRPV